MQITLNQEEITTAVENYVRSQISVAANQSIVIDFTAGRGDKGLSATLDIRPAALKGLISRSVTPASQLMRNTPDTVISDEAPEQPEGAAEEEEEPELLASTQEEPPMNEPSDAAEEGNEEPSTAPAKPRSIFAKAGA